MKTITDRHTLSDGQGQGMNWIRKEKRLAIYLRDGMACAYCRCGVDGGVRLTLDHLTPHTRGGTNAATNLVTACFSCNSSRQDKPVNRFATKRSLAFISKTISRTPDVSAAKRLIARRGGFTAALNA